jgi:DNA-binding transcriptional LysR family regulator
MELRQLRYFVAVAEELHFARAAERLHISPPSLTQQVQVLERQLGARLFNRTKRSVSLTDAGVEFLESARDTLRQAERTEMIGRRAGRGEIGRVEVGYVTSASCNGLVSRGLEAYREKHPLVDIRLHREETPSQLQALADGRLDVGFLRPPLTYPIGLTGFAMLEHALVVAMPSKHRLRHHDTIRLSMLRNETFISPTVEVEIGFASYVDAAAVAGRFSPKVVRRTPDMMSIITMVGAGFGVAIVPQSFRALLIPSVIYRPLALRRRAKIVLAFRKSEKSPAVLAFIERMKDFRLARFST